MAIDLEWHDDKQTIALMRFNADWTWDEVYRLAQDTDEIINTVDHTDPIDFIVNTSQLGWFKPGTNVRKLQEVSRHRNPRTRFVVIFGIAPLIYPILQTVLQAANFDGSISTARNEGEAVALIKSLASKKLPL